MKRTIDPSADHGQPSGAIEPRLLDVHKAAQYIGVSSWTLRDYIARGFIRVVEMPALTPREGARRSGNALRRVLIDRADLDQFVEALKVKNSGAPAIRLMTG